MILYSLLALVVILLLLLITPVGVMLRLDSDPPHAVVKIVVFGFVRIKLPVPSGQDKKNKLKKKRNKTRMARGKNRWRKIMRPDMVQGDALRRLFQACVRILAAVSLRGSYVYLRFGFDDPADTGVLYGMLIPWLQRRRDGHTLLIEPEFNHAAFHAILVLQLRLVLIRILYLLARLFISRPVRQFIFR